MQDNVILKKMHSVSPGLVLFNLSNDLFMDCYRLLSIILLRNSVFPIVHEENEVKTHYCSQVSEHCDIHRNLFLLLDSTTYLLLMGFWLIHLGKNSKGSPS